jgi:hypothetical protein
MDLMMSRTNKVAERVWGVCRSAQLKMAKKDECASQKMTVQEP